MGIVKKKRWAAAAVFMLFFTSMVNQLLNYILPLQFEKMDFRIAAAGLGLMTAACTGFLFLSEPVPAMICRILQGTAFGIASSVVPSVVMEMMKSAERSVGIIGISSISASLAGPFLALEIVKRNETSGFELVCLLAVCSALAGFLLCIWIPAVKTEKDAVTDCRRRASGGLIKYLFYTAAFLILCNCYMALLTVFAKSENKLEYVSVFLVTASLSSIIARAELSKIMKTARRLHSFLFLGAVFYGAAMLGISSPGGIAFFLGGTAIGLFSGIMMSCTHLDILKLDNKDSAHANTLFYFVQDIANILCGMIWAAAASYFGYELCFIWSGAGIVLLCGIFILYRIKIASLGLIDNE